MQTKRYLCRYLARIALFSPQWVIFRLNGDLTSWQSLWGLIRQLCVQLGSQRYILTHSLTCNFQTNFLGGFLKKLFKLTTVDLGYKNNAYSGFWDITYKCLRSRPNHSYFFVKIPLIQRPLILRTLGYSIQVLYNQLI